jgi:hypothetical protein
MEETEKTLVAYTKITELIRKEDELINHRVMSGLSINGVIGTLTAVGYGVARDNLKEPTDFIILGVVIAALVFLAIRACYLTIRSLTAARIQNAYLKNFYEVHWKLKVEENLNLPRPFGGFSHLDTGQDGNAIELGKNGAAALFVAIMGIWCLVLLILTIVSIRHFLL